MRHLLLVLGAGLLLAAPAAVAQDGKRVTPSSPPNSSWVKLCETPEAAGKDLLGKAQAIGVRTCLTLHERVDVRTGTRLFAMGVRQSEGRQTLTIMVPAGAERAYGVLVFIYPRSLWERKKRGERLQKHERNGLKELKLKFASCDAEACAVEIGATPELIDDLRSKGGLQASAIRNRRPMVFHIPLSGFRAAYDGPATDSARFRAARDEVLRELRERNKRRGRPPKRTGDQQI